MKIAHDAFEIACAQHRMVLDKLQLPPRVRDELHAATVEMVRAAALMLQREIEHERDQTRRAFYAEHPQLQVLPPGTTREIKLGR